MGYGTILLIYKTLNYNNIMSHTLFAINDICVKCAVDFPYF